MNSNDIGFAAVNRLKATLALNNIALTDCKFYRDRGCIVYYSVGGGYTLLAGTTGLTHQVHSVVPFDMVGLLEVKDVH